MSTFLFEYQRGPLAVAAGTPLTVDVPINGARNWVLVVKNVGANALTALTIAVSPLGELFEAATSVTTALPLAAGDSLPGIRGNGEPVRVLRLVLTSTSGTDVQLEGSGW
jgi:hypothetical protein